MSAMNPYRTLRQSASDEFIISKSRFIGYAAPCETEAEALAFLQSIRTKSLCFVRMDCRKASASASVSHGAA